MYHWRRRNLSPGRGGILAVAISFSFILAFLAVFPAQAQTKGSDTMQLLLIGSGGRAYMVAECLAAEDADIEALQYNPAGTANAFNLQFQASFISWYDDFSYGNTALSFPVKKEEHRSGNLFFSFKFLSLPRFDWIDIDGVVQNEKLSQNDFSLAAGYNRPLSRWLSAGADLRFVTSRLADAAATTKLPLLDAGVIFRLSSHTAPVRLALTARNIGIPVTYSGSSVVNNLPSELAFGFLLPAFRNPTNGSGINIMGRFSCRFNGVIGCDLGTEIIISRFFTIGGGYKFLSDAGKFMMGGSLRIPIFRMESRLNIAYLFSNHDQLDNVFVISLNLFGASAPVRRHGRPRAAVSPSSRVETTSPVPLESINPIPVSTNSPSRLPAEAARSGRQPP